MNRRQYLFRTGIGAATAATFAGCLDNFSDSDGSAAVEDRTGVRELSRAAGKLNDAALALDLGDDIDDPADLEFDPAEPNASIEAARDHLATAEAELPSDRDPDIETLRTYADVLEALVVVTETVADETLADDADAVFGATSGDGDLEDAAETLDERLVALSGAETRHEEAVSDFEALDGDRFEKLVRIERADLEAGISTLGDVLGSLATLGGGFDSMLEGYEALERGRERIDDNEYKPAEKAFIDARSCFERATTTLESDDEPPEGLRSHFETARCQSGHLETAASAFADSAAAASAGDLVTAQRRRRDGERALEQAEDCAQ